MAACHGGDQVPSMASEYDGNNLALRSGVASIITLQCEWVTQNTLSLSPTPRNSLLKFHH